LINKYPEIAIPVAVFKGGSGNDFAWKLYGDLTVSQYFDRVLSGITKQIDGAICNDHLFINGFGIGFDGAIVQSMRGKKKISAGHIAYLFSVIKNVLFFRETIIQMQVDQDEVRLETPFLIAVANGERYGGGFRIAPGAVLNDQFLDLILVKQISPFRRLSKIPLVQKGRHLSLDIVEHIHLKRILIEPSVAVPAHCDGEPIAAVRYEIKVLPGRYTVFA
ncbi:MAG TPA: hypothetical protein VLC28_04510, partial [Flavitalea sp.]|nr:hypothetical protein [Flavitalea sp.]